MTDYTTYTNKQLSEQLLSNNTIDPQLIKELANRISQVPDPELLTKERQNELLNQYLDQIKQDEQELKNQKITWANLIQLTNIDFELKDIDQIQSGQLFYPQLNDNLEIQLFQQDDGSKIGATADCQLLPIIKRQFKQAIKLTNLDMTKDIWDKYQIYNSKAFENLPVFVPTAGVFVLRKNVEVTESTMLNALELNQIDDWNSKLLKLKNLLGDSLIIVNTGLIFDLQVWTGEVKEFKFQFLGSMIDSVPYSDQGIGQYSLI